MNHHGSEAPVKIDPALKAYVDSVVRASVDEAVAGLQDQVTRALAQHREDTGAGLANRATLVVFSGEMDKLIAAFIIATGAAAMGMEVSLYVTFWALAALKRRTCFQGKPFTDLLTGLMLPSGPGHLGTSKLNMLGAGPAFFRHVMKKKNVASLADLITVARESGVRIIACQTAMEVMGIKPDELVEDLEFGGVATYLADARDARITLFI